jgi:FHS family glucose/mannose:H+ symporter-like MFS transporter
MYVRIPRAPIGQVAPDTLLLQNGVSPMSTAIAVPSAASSQRSALTLLFAGFVLTGVATVIVGPVLPVFISRWALDDSQAGLFFTVQFAASLGGVLLSGALTTRWGFRPALLLGYLAMSIGLGMLNAPTHAIALVATALFGGGYGLVIPGTNLFVAESGGARSASLLSFLNFAWGVGAVSCSPLIMLALRYRLLPALLMTFAVVGGLLTVAFLFVPIAAKKQTDHMSTAVQNIALPALWITAALAALFFIYVGMETSIGGWSAEHARRMVQGASLISTLAPMFFYAGLTVGRALAPLALLRIRENRLVFVALAIASAGTTVVIVSNTLPIALAGMTLAGFGCSSIYPIFIAWFSRWYGAAARGLGSIMFSLASLGGAAVPLWVGFVSKQAGSLRIGLLVPLFGAFSMIVILLLLRRQTRSEVFSTS